MPIKAKNIIVGGNSPTIVEKPKEEKVVQSFSEIKNVINKSVYVAKQKIVEEIEPSRYVEKTDGVLVRQINTKSSYLKDILDLDS